MKRARAIQPGKQGSMHISRFFLAGILLLSLPVFGAGLLASAALPQATNNPAASPNNPASRL